MENSAAPGLPAEKSRRRPSRTAAIAAGTCLASLLGLTGESAFSQELSAVRDVTTVPAARRPAQADVVRFLEQATFGPTDALVAHVGEVGFKAFLDEQVAAPPSLYPDLPAMPADQKVGCPTGSPDTCVRDNYTMFPLQVCFFQNALGGPDQLRQRVALALHEILVVSGVTLRQPSMVGPYLNLLQAGALGSFRTLLRDVTLSPAMGNYLNMVNNVAAVPPANVPPNENYAREVLQLFTIGIDVLNEDGTPKLDTSGQPLPAYTQETIEEFAQVFTGWTYATLQGASPRKTNPANFKAAMWLYRDAKGLDATHEKASKTLLDYPGAPHAVLPANQDGAVDLDQALDNIFYHPNVGPFIGRQLIQHLVTSNPSPAYVARVARAFADDGHGVRGNLAAVVSAILLDPEARGPEKSDPPFGHLREPVLFVTSLCRALGAKSDGVLAGQASAMGQNLFYPPTVFSYFPPDHEIADGVLGPEFGIESSTTAISRVNFVTALVFNGIGRTAATGGTTVDLSAWNALASDPAALVSAVDRLLLHGTMTGDDARAVRAAVAAVSASSPPARVKTAISLVASSPAYQVAQ